jgi:hypothetical protein
LTLLVSADDGAGKASAGEAATGAATGSSGVVRPVSSAANLASRLVTNWARSLPDTSLIMPLPNWASFPLIFRSVSTLTLVLSPSATSTAVIRADALPADRASRPFASITPR